MIGSGFCPVFEGFIKLIFCVITTLSVVVFFFCDIKL